MKYAALPVNAGIERLHNDAARIPGQREHFQAPAIYALRETSTDAARYKDLQYSQRLEDYRVMVQRKHLRKKVKLIEAVAITVFLLIFATTAAAEHESDHRYDVRGHVLDARKKPLSGVPVTILMDTQTIGSGRTDSKGYYSVRLHLHDSDIGRVLTVRAGDTQAEIRMQAKRGDQTTARVHHLNFVGGEFEEKKLAAGSIPTWAYIAAAPLVLWGVVYVGGATRRKVRRAKSGKGKKKGKAKG